MFDVLEKQNRTATTLKHGENIFHEALSRKENYYHVVTEDDRAYDIAYTKNNDTIPENYRKVKAGIEISPSYLSYDENATDTLDLSLLQEVRAVFCHTLNEYSVVIARLALKHTTDEVYFVNPLAKIFLGENPRLHIVEQFPAFDENETLQIVDGFFIGYFDKNFHKLNAVAAFHSIFFKQSFTNLNLADVKYFELSIAKNVGVGGILSYYTHAKEIVEREGWQIYLKENCTRYPQEMLQKYFRLASKPQDSTPANTIYLPDVVVLTSTYHASKFDFEIDENILTENFRAEMDEYADAVLGNHNVLGVLIRGTDYILSKMGGVRQMATVDDMLPMIREWIDADGYDLIFLATEDQDILDRMKKEFGSMIRIVSQVRHSVRDFQNLKLLSDLEKKEQADNVGLAEDNTVNYFYALYLLSKCQSFMASGQCHGWNVVNSFKHGEFKRRYKFQVGLKSKT